MKIGVIAEICNAKSGARAPIELAKALAKNNQVFFYATNTNKDAQTQKDLENSGIQVTLLPLNKTPLLGKWFTGFRLIRVIQNDKPQVLSTHCTLPLFIGSKLSGIPIVMTYHGTQFNILKEKVRPRSPKYILLQPLDKILNLLIFLKSALPILTANRVISVSQYTKRELKELYRKTSIHAYLGAAPRHFLQTTEVGFTKNEKVRILSVSRITPYKGFHHLIKIYNQTQKTSNNAELIIAGSLGSKKYLNYLKQISGEKVSFFINVADQKLARLYQSCDLYATCDRYLFFGMPLLEAASFSKPSLALNFRAANEVVRHGDTGFVANSLQEFKNYLEKLIQNQKLRDTLGKNAKKRALREFSWEQTARVYLSTFQQVLEKG